MFRIVDGVECEIKDHTLKNEDLFEAMGDLCRVIRNDIVNEIPVELKNKIDDVEYKKAIEDTIDYTIMNIRESAVSNGTFLEDALCHFYDKVENMNDDKDGYSDFYMKLWCKPSDKAMVANYVYSNQIHAEFSNDPLRFTIEEAIDDAVGRGLTESDDIKLDTFMQIDSAINESDIFDVYVDDYMIRNSI